MKRKLIFICAIVFAVALLIGGTYGALILLQPFQRDNIVGYGDNISLLNRDISPMQLREDGSFTVLQFTDTHLVHARGRDARTLRMIEYHTARLQPDLVVITGDVIEGRAAQAHLLVDRRAALQGLVGIFARLEQPWVFLHGNNDHDNFLGTGDDIAAFLAVHCENIMIAQQAGLPGSVNFTLPLLDRYGEIAHQLMMLDSLGRFDTMQPEQADWLAAQLQDDAHASVFMHYPTQLFARAGLSNFPRPFDDAMDELFVHPNVGLVSVGHTHPEENRRIEYGGTMLQIVRASGYRRGDRYPGGVLITITPGAEEIYEFYDFAF